MGDSPASAPGNHPWGSSDTLLDLARSRAVSDGDLPAALAEITETAAEVLEVERAGVWFLDGERTALRCTDLYECSAGTHSPGPELTAAECPRYFEALQTERALAAHDARTDPRTLELTRHYLDPLDIASVLSAAIILDGKMVGVVCHEHTGGPRRWTSHDRNVAATMADVVARAMAAAERRRADEALRESEAKYRALVEQIPAITYVVSPDVGVATYVSPQIERLLGFTPEEWLSSPQLWIHQIHPADRERAVAEAERCRGAGEDLAIEYRMHARDGDVLWFRDEAMAIRDDDGRPLCWQGVLLDITSRRVAEDALHQREAQLVQSQKMEAIGRLAGGVAHDFNNLLTAIVGYSDLALARAGNDESLRSQIGGVRKAADRATSLTRRLLAFSRKQVMQPKLLDLNQVVADMSGMLERLIGEDVSLVTRLSPEIGAVRADPVQLQQVIMNLVVNARDAMPDGGTLTLQTSETPGDLSSEPRVVLTARDDGCGMERETLDHIFEPFFTTKERGRGTGLGLPTAYGIVAQSGGSIEVESEPGQGTTVRVLLPRVDEQVRQVEGANAPTETLPGHETILLAEDEDGVRELARRFLGDLGYRVLAAEHGQAALELAERHAGRIDLLLTDVVMPRLGGRSLARQLAESRRGLKVLYISGYSGEILGREGNVDAGIQLIQKPFQLRELAHRIRELLDGGPTPRA
jgi:PAS domain S-box-containing protein